MSNKMCWIDSLWAHTTKIYSLCSPDGPIRGRLERAMVRPMVLSERTCRVHRTGRDPDWYVQPIDRSAVFVGFTDRSYPFADSGYRIFYCDLGAPLNGLVYRVMGAYLSNRR